MSKTVAWQRIEVEDLNDYLVSVKMDALREVALANGQDDPFEAVMPDVVARIRNKIKSNRTNRVSATTNTVPPELFTCACYLIIEAMNSRLPANSVRLTEDQKEIIRKCERDLTDVVSGSLVISAPTDPEDVDVQAGGAAQVVTSSTRVCTRSKMNGL